MISFVIYYHIFFSINNQKYRNDKMNTRQKTVFLTFAALFMTLWFCTQPNREEYNTAKCLIQADDYLKNRYFFLDNTYRRYYIKKYALQGGSLSTPAPPPVKELSVWRSFNRTFTEKRPEIDVVRLDSLQDVYLFEQLERDRHYYLNENEGDIRFTDSVYLLPDQQAAIYMRVEDSSVEYAHLQKGSYRDTSWMDAESGEVIQDIIRTLRVLCPIVPIDSFEDDTSRYRLMWRHAYGLISGIQDDHSLFECSVQIINRDSYHRLEKNGEEYFGDIMGISEGNIPFVDNTHIFNREFNDLIIPPWDTSDAGLDIFNNPALGEWRDSIMYKYSDKHQARSATAGYQPMYKIEVTVRTPIDEDGE